MTTRKKPRRPSRELLKQLQPAIHLDGATYQQQWIQCSKPNCTKWHGPYWYAFFHKTGTRSGTKSKYVGKNLPPAIVEQVRAAADSVTHIAAEATREKRARKKDAD